MEIKTVSAERLELSTNGLKGHCSTIELRTRYPARSAFYHAPYLPSTEKYPLTFPISVIGLDFSYQA